MRYTQPGLIGGVDEDPEGLIVPPPVARQHPGWEKITYKRKSDKPEPCAHCRLIWAANPGHRIRNATWIRYGRWGGVLYLCPGHRALQHQADYGKPIGG